MEREDDFLFALNTIAQSVSNIDEGIVTHLDEMNKTLSMISFSLIHISNTLGDMYKDSDKKKRPKLITKEWLDQQKKNKEETES